MMSKDDEIANIVFANLRWLVCIVLPAVAVLFVLREGVQEGMSYGAVGLVALVYVTPLIPAIVGATLHSLTLAALSRRIHVTRLIAILTSPIALGVILLMVDFNYLLIQWIPITIGGLLYMGLIRLPPSRLVPDR
ncbi:hypothetical protein [Gemmatimonas aurantiaca]|uniref:hypothetical protein n=1 Tax=Gemmatimonas aurantiaca TaxID=173480 RepID=UPI00301D2742